MMATGLLFAGCGGAVEEPPPAADQTTSITSALDVLECNETNVGVLCGGGGYVCAHTCAITSDAGIPGLVLCALSCGLVGIPCLIETARCWEGWRGESDGGSGPDTESGDASTEPCQYSAMRDACRRCYGGDETCGDSVDRRAECFTNTLPTDCEWLETASCEEIASIGCGDFSEAPTTPPPSPPAEDDEPSPDESSGSCHLAAMREVCRDCCDGDPTCRGTVALRADCFEHTLPVPCGWLADASCDAVAPIGCGDFASCR